MCSGDKVNDVMNKILYCQHQFPVFQNRMYPSQTEAINCPKGNIKLEEDQYTGLVFNAAFSPELMVYDKHYQNEQAVSGFFLRHLKQVGEIVERWMGKDNLVEVGCGKGFFLEMLCEKGFDITGFDPAYEGSNPLIRRNPFAPGVLNRRISNLILRHVLEHIHKPIDFLNKLKDGNGGSGKIYIEVPCFDWICEHKAWFDVFYEHVNYFRLSDFHRMFGNVIHSGKLFNGQYLYVIADLSSLRIPKIDKDDQVDFPRDFIANLTNTPQKSFQNTAIWGGIQRGYLCAAKRACRMPCWHGY